MARLALCLSRSLSLPCDSLLLYQVHKQNTRDDIAYLIEKYT
jgi:hypothetical protein